MHFSFSMFFQFRCYFFLGKLFTLFSLFRSFIRWQQNANCEWFKQKSGKTMTMFAFGWCCERVRIVVSGDETNERTNERKKNVDSERNRCVEMKNFTGSKQNVIKKIHLENGKCGWKISGEHIAHVPTHRNTHTHTRYERKQWKLKIPLMVTKSMDLFFVLLRSRLRQCECIERAMRV